MILLLVSQNLEMGGGATAEGPAYKSSMYRWALRVLPWTPWLAALLARARWEVG